MKWAWVLALSVLGSTLTAVIFLDRNEGAFLGMSIWIIAVIGYAVMFADGGASEREERAHDLERIGGMPGNR